MPPMYMYTTILRVLAKERRSSLQQANNRLDSELHVADVFLLVTGRKAIQQLLTRRFGVFRPTPQGRQDVLSIVKFGTEEKTKPNFTLIGP